MEIPKHATAPQLAQTFVDKVLLEAGNGICQTLVSDHDALMTSEFWQALFKRLGTTLSMSAARSQQTNGAVERVIAVIEEIFRTKRPTDKSEKAAAAQKLGSKRSQRGTKRRRR